MLRVPIDFLGEVNKHGAVVAVVVLVKSAVSNFNRRGRVVGKKNVVDSFVASYVCGNIRNIFLCVGEGISEVGE